MWDVYRSTGGGPRVGDVVRLRGSRYRVLGSQGADADGVPYLRLELLDEEGRPVEAPLKMALATDVEKSG